MPDHRNQQRPILLGHRGARKYAAENTIAAFQQALADGCDGFEFDVRLTSDRQCVICHDPKFRGLQLSRCEYSNLRENCGDMPLLEEVLQQFASRAFLNIELKVKGTEPALLEMLARHAPQRGCIVSSFLPEVVDELSKVGAKYPLGIICENQRQLARWPELPVQAVMLHQKLVKQSLVDELHRAGKQVFVWTVNEERQMNTLSRYGVDGIISDDARLLAATLGQGVGSNR